MKQQNSFIGKASVHASPRNKPLRLVRSLALPIGLALLLTGIASVSAQSYSIDFFTIDGGGGTSSGGQFSVSGTISQPDAGKLTGGQFTLDGGFWGIDAAVLVNGSPNLRITRTTTNYIVIAWPLTVGAFQLQQNPVFGTANWSNVSATVNVVGAENQVLVPKTLLGNKFYRLQSQ